MKMFNTLALTAALTLTGGFASVAFAGAGCCPSTAAAEAAKISKVSTDGESCATACADKAAKMADASCAEACSKGEQVAKGGAADAVKAGYAIGEQVPNFTLTDTAGNSYSLDSRKGNVTVLVFYNQACPYVVEVRDRLSSFTTSYAEKGVGVWAIDAGINNTEDAIKGYDEKVPYSILVDRTSNSARNFKATRTPEVFVLDRDNVVRYHGAFDNGQAGSAEGARQSFVQAAVDALLKGEQPVVNSTKAFGCTIKFNPETTASAPAAADAPANS